MKRIFMKLSSLLLAISLTACGVGNVQPAIPPPVVPSSITQDVAEPSEKPTSELTIQVTGEQGETILFALNNSNAAKSLYEQLPLSLEIEDYSDDEKIFYPPEKLDTSNSPMAEGPVGTLAYYAPWGDVAIYYDACAGASGLYQLGQALSGTEHISSMQGVIRLEAVDRDDPLSEPAQTDAESTFKEPSMEAITSLSPKPSPPVQAVAPPKQEGSITKPPTQEETKPVPTSPEAAPPSVPPAPEEVIRSMQIAIGNKNFSATFAENNAVDAFIELMKTAPVVINMSDYSGFEKVGSLGTSLPTSNSSITTNVGDIVLYNGNQIVVFYGSNSWSYTRLGEIDDLSGLKEALGDGDVTVIFSIN